MLPTLFLSFIHTYGLMLAVGFYAAWWLGARRAKAEGIDPDIIGNVVLIAIVSGVAGARLLFFIRYHDPRESFWSIFIVWEGGLVFYGGLITAAAAIAFYLWRRKIPMWQMGDILAPSLALGQAFGRLGCFFNGCCFGGPSTAAFPLGIRFPCIADAQGTPVGSPAFLDQVARRWLADTATASLAVHPTQLCDAFMLFVITGLIVAATFYRRRYGELLALYAILNGISRFGTELIRRDAEAGLFGLTDGQLGAILVIFIGVILFGWVRRRGTPVPCLQEL
jgi:phosphatidylglycerol:prolipoprotein diacylglycerol transferase